MRTLGTRQPRAESNSSLFTRFMPDLLAARSQMAMSLAFHIIFAVVGIGMPALMVLAERRWQRTRDPVALDLAKRWAKGTAILFAVGAVSGTVLSFELGLLWPGFMEYAGPIIGMPFSLEGFAFFTEAIFLGIYLYGWDRISERMHLTAGVLVALSGAVSGIFVVIANAWMNAPVGFEVVGGRPVNIDPLRAMLTPAAFSQTLHMTLAAYAATGLAVAGIHAALLLRDPLDRFHRIALGVALWVGAPAAVLQPISGDLSAKFVAEYQPVKLAAMEGQFATERGAPLRIGGWPDEARGETRWALEVPYALSILAFGSPSAEVKGLAAFPRENWPPVAVVHVAFQIMVALGTLMAAVSLWAAWLAWRKRTLAEERWLLRALVAAAPMGFVAIEAGWTVTEVGRQPWIIYGVMRTAEAVTPMPGLVVPFVTFTLLYVFLGVIVVWLLYRQILSTPGSIERRLARRGAWGPTPAGVETPHRRLEDR
jgi:cytochrome bd ubiquinol oxidase subunit I